MTDADRLRSELARLRLSQAALARRLDVTPRHMSRWATGRCAVPAAVWLAIRGMRPTRPA